MTGDDDVSLQYTWWKGIQELDIHQVELLLDAHPDLIWSRSSSVVLRMSDTSLVQLIEETLGLTTTCFNNLNALLWLLLHYQESNAKYLVSFLLNKATTKDIIENTYWGDRHNTLFHLVSLLDDTNLACQLLEKGVPNDIANTHGCLPSHVAQSEMMVHLLDKKSGKKAASPPPSPSPSPSRPLSPNGTAIRPNYSNPDRFQQLQQLAQSTGMEKSLSSSSSASGASSSTAATIDTNAKLKKQNKDEHFFRQGYVEQTKQKVLTDEQVELEKHREKRRKDIALLTKRSAVKNNPFVKKADSSAIGTASRQLSSSTSSHAISTDDSLSDAITASTSSPLNGKDRRKIKRNSKVINSLQTKSYVSSSVFRQGQSSHSVIPRRKLEPTTFDSSVDGTLVTSSSSSPSPSELDKRDEPPSTAVSLANIDPPSSTVHTEEDSGEDDSDSDDSDVRDSDVDEIYHDPLQTMPLTARTTSRETAESEKCEITQASLVDNLPCKTASSAAITTEVPQQEAEQQQEEEEKGRSQTMAASPLTEVITNTHKATMSTSTSPSSEASVASISLAEIKTSTYHSSPISNNSASSSPASATQCSSSTQHDSELSSKVEIDSRRLSGSQKSHWSKELTSWASILDREFSLKDNQDNQNADTTEKPVANGNSISTLPLFGDLETNLLKETTGTKKHLEHDKQFNKENGINDSDGMTEEEDDDNGHIHRKKSSPALSDYERRRQGRDGAIFESARLPLKSYGSVAVRSTATYARRLPTFETTKGTESPVIHSPQQMNTPVSTAATLRDAHHRRYTPIGNDLKMTRSASASDSTSLPVLSTIDDQHNHSQQWNQNQQYDRHLLPPLPPPNNNHTQQQHRQQQEHKQILSRQDRHHEPQQPQGLSSRIRLPLVSNAASDSNHGKLYVRVNGVHDILLPLPRERAHVRCVIGDGRYEYMSRYETLGQNISFGYECIIDSHPDMIVTLSLHVRPDYVLKKPLSRLFTSNRKRKGSLSAYVSSEDGAVGQTRFAVNDMLAACHRRSYSASFHCFNAWYVHSRERSFSSSSSSSRAQQELDQGVLKVVGNFEVELLYLPVSSPSLPVPKNLRECDMAIKIQQWNDTCLDTEHYPKINRPPPRVA